MRRLEKCTYFTSTIVGIALRKEKEHRKTGDTDRKKAPRTILDLQSLCVLTHETRLTENSSRMVSKPKRMDPSRRTRLRKEMPEGNCRSCASESKYRPKAHKGEVSLLTWRRSACCPVPAALRPSAGRRGCQKRRRPRRAALPSFFVSIFMKISQGFTKFSEIFGNS